MNLCPADGVDTFRIFNGNDGPYNPSQRAVYRDNVQSYSTTEPAIDLTSTSFLMLSWRLAGRSADLWQMMRGRGQRFLQILVLDPMRSISAAVRPSFFASRRHVATACPTSAAILRASSWSECAV